LTLKGTCVRDVAGLSLHALPSRARSRERHRSSFVRLWLEHVGLSEAFELCLLIVTHPARFERAALRWHGRYSRETRDVTFDEEVAVLVLLGAMRGPRATLAASALADLLSRRGLERPCETLVAWAQEA
jgi:hypothetical protein